MSAHSNITWTESTWNPVTGCSKVSAGCQHCYAERMARRRQGMGMAKYRNGFELTLHPDVLNEPLRLKRPHIIFVNSMSDLFHEKIPFDYVERVFDVMRRCPHHLFQILTKRSKHLKRLHKKLDWPENVWMGVTVENADYTSRIDDLRATGAFIKWLSLEPLLGPIPDMDLSGIDWLVAGGESGPGARIMKQAWVLDVLRQCRQQNVAFFFKQWGGINKKTAGRTLRGRTYEELPDCPQLAAGQVSLF